MRDNGLGGYSPKSDLNWRSEFVLIFFEKNMVHKPLI